MGLIGYQEPYFLFQFTLGHSHEDEKLSSFQER